MALAKTLYMIAGLPRSGSTLLTNLLGQNPDFHVTPTSGILDMLLNVKNQWDRNPAFRAQDLAFNDTKKRNVLTGMLDGYFADQAKPICIDKNRGWPAHLEMMEQLTGARDKVKVLVTVRDLRDVLASFELLHRKTAGLGITHQEYSDPKKSRTAAGRMEILVDQDQPVGRAFTTLRDAYTRGWGDCMHLIEYEQLTSHPEAVLDGIYQFLELPRFSHDVANVEQVTHEDDSSHGYRDLHTIRKEIVPQAPKWPDVFDQVVRNEPVWEQVEMMSQFWRAQQPPRS